MYVLMILNSIYHHSQEKKVKYNKAINKEIIEIIEIVEIMNKCTIRKKVICKQS